MSIPVLDQSSLIDDESFFNDIIAVADDQRAPAAAAETAGVDADVAETQGAETQGAETQGADFVFIGNDGLPGAIISDRMDDDPDDQDSSVLFVEDLWSGLRPTPALPTAPQQTAAPPAEATGDEAAGAEAASDEAAGAEAAGDEAAGAEAAGDETGVPIAPVLGALSQLAGHHFEGTGAFVEHYERLIDERDGFAALQELLEKDTEANLFIAALINGENAQSAAVEHIPGLSSAVPEDPDEAATYWQRVGEKQAQTQNSKSQKAQRAKGRKRIADKAARAFNATVQKRKLTDAQEKEFLHDASIIQAGDLSRDTIRPDTYDVLYNGLHFEPLAAAREEAAFKRGVEQGLKGAQARVRGSAPQLPTITGGGGKRQVGRHNADTPAERALGVIDSLSNSEGQAIFNAF